MPILFNNDDFAFQGDKKRSQPMHEAACESMEGTKEIAPVISGQFPIYAGLNYKLAMNAWKIILLHVGWDI